MDDLAWNQADLVRAAHVSDTQLRKFMNGTATGMPRPSTLRRIELALSWPNGTCRDLLDGKASPSAVVPTELAVFADAKAMAEGLNGVMPLIINVERQAGQLGTLSPDALKGLDGMEQRFVDLMHVAGDLFRQVAVATATLESLPPDEAERARKHIDDATTAMNDFIDQLRPYLPPDWDASA